MDIVTDRSSRIECVILTNICRSQDRREDRFYNELSVAHDEIHAGLFKASPLVQNLLYGITGHSRKNFINRISPF